MQKQFPQFTFPNQTDFYRGKVRDVYTFGDKMVAVATDRISAFDVVLPRAIPGKGQILNEIAAHFLEATRDIIPNWLVKCPLPNVSFGIKCEAIQFEMIVREYLCGSLWRSYKEGERTFWDVTLPDGLKEWQQLPVLLYTPTTKAEAGHDENITSAELIKQGIVTEHEWAQICEYSRKLFLRGQSMAHKKGLILVDTKYEFGRKDGQIYLIDEVHTPDSSRYIYKHGYEGRLAAGMQQKQLSKEFVREWLMENGFGGKEGQEVPEMSDSLVASISARYAELYEAMLGKPFVLHPMPEDFEECKKTLMQAIVPLVTDSMVSV